MCAYVVLLTLFGACVSFDISGTLLQTEPKPERHSYRRFGRSFELVKPVEEHRVFYIGIEGPTLTNLMLNYNKCQFYSYNPFTRESRRETLNVNKALGRRYFLVQKAKEARTVGILIGTLGAAKYLDIIERLKHILKHAGKKVTYHLLIRLRYTA